MEWKIVHIDETDSTNRWLKDHGEDNMVVVADYQTAGRGCGTNTWESERGKNLLISILMHPVDIPAGRQFVISQVTSVALCKVLEQYVSNVSIKWPNDIYVGDRKICGMLIENHLQGSVIRDSIIGIGLNVNQMVFHSDAPNPISLANLTARMYDKEVLLQQLLEAFDAEWADVKGVRSRYMERLYRRKGFFRYRDAWRKLWAELATVEDDGHLVLRDVDGYINRYAFKEVQFIIEN